MNDDEELKELLESYRKLPLEDLKTARLSAKTTARLLDILGIGLMALMVAFPNIVLVFLGVPVLLLLAYLASATGKIIDAINVYIAKFNDK